MPSYPLTPDRVTELKVTRDVLLDAGGLVGAGAAFLETRRAKGDSGNPKKTWSLLHDHISLSDWQTLLSFFEARVGKWETFTFTDPSTEVEHTVRFDTDVLRADKPLGREYSPVFVVEVRLKEVL